MIYWEQWRKSRIVALQAHREEEEKQLKLSGNEEYEKIAEANYQQRLRDLHKELAVFEKRDVESVKEPDGGGENNIDSIFEFLEKEPRHSISKEMPGGMFAVSI